MTADQLSVEMLPADQGDALWIEWGAASDRHRMLIDGGTRRTFDLLKRRFLQMDESDRRLDLLVVTHIDLDHIDGAIELLRDESLSVHYDDIWFNDHRHLNGEPAGGASRNAVQGEFLSAVLADRGLPWNQSFHDGAIVVPPTGSLPAVTLAGGLRLVLVSPTPEKLAKLGQTWEKTLADAKPGLEPGQRDEWLAVLEERRGPAERSTRVRFGGDGSSANGSSIAFIAEYGNERWLLAGDAHNEVLLAGLRRYAIDTGESLPIRLDGFKLPHHGSVRNISPELLDIIRCRKFLISSSGAYFKHPDEAAIDLLTECSDRPELVFNYSTEFTEKWRTDSDRYTATYLDTSDGRDRYEQESAMTEAPIESAPEGPTREVAPQIAGTVARPKQAPAGPPITVTVHHGSLDQADFPVVVGHYLATPLSGAEGFINSRFDGRLAERLDRNTYVGDIGEYAYVPAPARRLPKQGALVVGLGEYGELTPLRLVEAMREALVRHALDVADRDQGTGELKLGISSVLIAATGAHGLTIAASANAIVDAVREANRDLRGGSGKVRAHYTKVQIFERNAPEAELAFLALFRAADDEQPDRPHVPGDELIRPTQLLEAGGGLQNSLPSDSAEVPWWRIRITESPSPPSGSDPGHYLDLEFAVGGRLARAGTVMHQVERRRLERMLRKAVGLSALSTGLHTTLFELLFPNQLKWDLMAAQDIQLEVDDTTADIPWEMLAARNPKEGTRGELALRSPLVRQLRVDVSGAIARASKKTALVIGNPPVGNLGPPLAGAYEEAKAVAAVLRGPGKVERYSVNEHCYAPDVAPTGDTTMGIESALFEDDYRIVHMAAHGVLQPDDPTRTGVAIGPDDFVTANVFGQLNVTPDLVFLNCCHVGAVQTGIQTGPMDFTRRNLNRLAASLARQLIRSGVRAVIVAGWAVDDAAAKRFAETFYEKMLEGEPFGRAVHKARHAAVAQPGEPPSSTWGAYQCYGDAGYRLPDSESDGRKAADPSTRREVLRRLESLVSWIETIGVGGNGDDDRELALYELAVLERTATKHQWLSKKPGHLAEEFAKAWGALGEFAKAIEFYQQALAAPDGQVTLSGVEQLANLRDRWATKLMREPKPSAADRQTAVQLLTDSMDGLERLEAISGSGERSALRAGYHKRRAATAATDEERAGSLKLAVDAYRASYHAEKQPYTVLNYVQLDEIRSRLDGAEPAWSDLGAEYEAAITAAENFVQSSGDYWDAVAHADGKLTEAIVRNSVHDDRDEIIELYRCAFECRSTAKSRASTLDHLRDLADIHPDPDQKKALAELYESATSIGGPA